MTLILVSVISNIIEWQYYGGMKAALSPLLNSTFNFDNSVLVLAPVPQFYELW